MTKAVGIDGITISGGEPFDQIDELGNLVSFLASYVSTDIVVYTGYTYNEVVKKNGSKLILDNISTLIDGAYQSNLDNGIGLRGSTNQHVVRIRGNNNFDFENAPRRRQGFLFGDNLFAAGLRSGDG